jgi:hypothetical protein
MRSTSELAEKPRRAQALRQVQQEGGQPLFGAHAAQQQHHAMVAHDLAAHDLVELALQVENSRDRSSSWW